jgi:hypothetical protein
LSEIVENGRDLRIEFGKTGQIGRRRGYRGVNFFFEEKTFSKIFASSLPPRETALISFFDRAEKSADGAVIKNPSAERTQMLNPRSSLCSDSLRAVEIID